MLALKALAEAPLLLADAVRLSDFSYARCRRLSGQKLISCWALRHIYKSRPYFIQSSEDPKSHALLGHSAILHVLCDIP